MIRILLIGILILLIARAFWRLVDGIIETAGGVPKRRDAAPPGVTLVRDPVCGTHLPASRALSLSTPSGPQYFCSEACRDRYRKSA